MITTNLYFDLALQKIASLVLSCVSLPKDQALFRKGQFEQYPSLQLAANKISTSRLGLSSVNDHGARGGNRRKTLAIFYAQQLLQAVFKINVPTKLAIHLYARQLLKPQKEIFLEKYSHEHKRALIISSDLLEQNIFSTLLRSQCILPTKAQSKTEILNELKNNYDVLIVSSAFQAMDAHAIAQIASTGATQPILISISDYFDDTLEKLGFHLALQHPFSLIQFLAALKQFL